MLVPVFCPRRAAFAVPTLECEWWVTVTSTAATVCCSCRHHERRRRCLRRHAAPDASMFTARVFLCRSPQKKRARLSQTPVVVGVVVVWLLFGCCWLLWWLLVIVAGCSWLYRLCEVSDSRRFVKVHRKVLRVCCLGRRVSRNSAVFFNSHSSPPAVGHCDAQTLLPHELSESSWLPPHGGTSCAVNFHDQQLKLFRPNCETVTVTVNLLLVTCEL